MSDIALRTFAIAALAVSALGCRGLHAQPGSLQSNVSLVMESFSGEAALATVRALDRYWRHPGNRGFDASVASIVAILRRAGYVDQLLASDRDDLVYHVERHPMRMPTWEPVRASLTVVGDERPLLEFSTNRNMMAVYSHSTPAGALEAEVVYVGQASAGELAAVEIGGKIVFGEAALHVLNPVAVSRGAAGVLGYSIPHFNRPSQNRTAIVHDAISYDGTEKTWAVLLSTAARDELKRRLARGTVRVRVELETNIYPSHDQAVVAEVRGTDEPGERFVFSAHLQEPGANDNASGVATLAEIAVTAARLKRAGRFAPGRTLTMLWGDEFTAANRYLREDRARARRVLWGVSLDMVGQDTSKTGGSFLIEKMPDPSAVWTRGEDRHSEWGGSPLSVEDMTPHYLNDVVIDACRMVGRRQGWTVNTNPYEGGSDHDSFLAAGRPGLLLWHFTDQFYHTDLDRPDKVSASTMANVGTCALAVAMTLTSADHLAAVDLLDRLSRAASERLQTERALSVAAISDGAPVAGQRQILNAWIDWYLAAAESGRDIEVNGPSAALENAIVQAQRDIRRVGDDVLKALGED